MGVELGVGAEVEVRVGVDEREGVCVLVIVGIGVKVRVAVLDGVAVAGRGELVGVGSMLAVVSSSSRCCSEHGHTSGHHRYRH